MANREPATAVGADPKTTEVGSVFVSNYPPYSFWDQGTVEQVHRAIDAPPAPDTALGMYAHIPFCRKRCKFCYFRVFTDKNGAEVQTYLDALHSELELYARRAIVGGRPLKFVYFGGGTPSFIGSNHLRALVGHMRSLVSWDEIEEVTFECEPGTLTQPKLQTIRELGITRLSLGVENFDDAILAENGRAHVSKEIYRVAPWIDELDFDQLNIDLIAGMIGETWESWKVSVAKAIELDPDSVTVYQLELPYNTVYSRQVLDGGGPPVADWALKREWHDYAFREFEAAGYEVSSGYTVVKRGSNTRFVYRNSVWQGCDLLSIGVSSFGHLGGLHYQNVASWTPYLEQVQSGKLPIDRGFAPTAEERLTREMILQLKLGRLDPAYFQAKYGASILDEYSAAFARLSARNLLSIEDGGVRLSREGLLRVDSLLPEFYASRYQNARYT